MRNYLLILILATAACGRIRGNDGSNGAAGVNGHSVVFSQAAAEVSLCPNGGYALSFGSDLNDDHLLQSYETTNLAVVCNGTDGRDAVLPQFTPVAIVDPCGTNPNIHNEIFFRLANRQLIASFSDNVSGDNTRFSLLKPGVNYVTTDGDHCVFSVDANYNIVNESHRF